MRALGRAALTVLAAGTVFVALVPFLAVLMLGAPSVGRIAADPATVHAVMAGLQAGAVVLAAGWPIGVLAALALWGARRLLRRVVLGSAVLAILVAIAQPFVDGSGWLPTVVPSIAAAASVATLILTGTLNTIDPSIRQTAEAAGASPPHAWLVILASLGRTLRFAAATSFTMGFVLCTRMPGQVTLAGLVRRAAQHADVETAPLAMLLALLSLIPLILAGVVFPGRWLSRS